MAPNYIIFAIPVFFLLIGVEAFISWRRQLRYYRFNDALSDLCLGIGEQVFSVFNGAIIFVLGYVYIYNHFRLFDLSPTAIWVWVVAFVLKDFFYYWAHRMSHEINILWAGHAPHHQSEDYNLAVALRQGAFQGPFTAPFGWPMALLGFPPVLYLVVGQFNTIYQFWIHTRAIGTLGPLELLFNTPSHHRVHHGKNRKYLDRNHAGIFIIWDKLFGTFEPEDEEPVYGTIEPLQSWNPLWAQVKYLVTLARLGWESPRRIDILRIWFMRAGWTPAGGLHLPEGYEEVPEFRHKYNTRVPLGLNLYALVNFVMLLGLGVLFLIGGAKLPWPQRLGAGVFIALSLLSVGGVFEARRWMLRLEALRLLAAVAVITLWLGTLAGGIALVIAVGLGGWLWAYRSEFLRGPAEVDPIEPERVQHGLVEGQMSLSTRESA